MQRRKNKPQSRAQSFAEYALLIAVAAGVLVAMRIYVVRAVQEKYRQSADVFGQGEQYEKGVTVVTNLDSNITTLSSPAAGPTASCSFVVNRVAELEKQIKDLRARAEAWDRSAADTEAQLPELKARVAALTAEANQKEAQAKDLRGEAAARIQEAEAKEKQIDQYKKDYAYCFSGPYDETICPDILSAVTGLETAISDLHSQAETLNNEASQLEAQVKNLRSQAEALNNSIVKFQEQVQNLRAMARDFREEGDGKEGQITQYKKDYPKCL